MLLERVRVRDVRCLGLVELELGATQNYVFGPNGAGKTSLLEAMFFLGRGRSFRTRQTSRLIRYGQRGLEVLGHVRVGEAVRRIGVSFRAGDLEIRIDGSATGLAELARLFPVHVIDPRAHDLIEAGPSGRRRFLDAGVFHVEQSYLSVWRDFRRALRQRNAALKQGAIAAELGVWDEAVVGSGLAVDAARRRYLGLLAEHFGAIAGRLLERPAALEYRPGWPSGQALDVALKQSRKPDFAAGYTQIGPHRADIAVRLDAVVVRDMASRGQQKLLVAALVLAQVAALASARGEGGLLLVDDPAAELDAGALGRLRAELEALDAQLVITGISEQLLAPEPHCPVFHVEQGRIRAVV